MKKIAIVGAGPTGIYTLFSLLQQQTPLSISIFEQADEAGDAEQSGDDRKDLKILQNRKFLLHFQCLLSYAP